MGLGCQGHLPVTLVEVQRQNEASLPQLVNQVIYSGQGVAVEI